MLRAAAGLAGLLGLAALLFGLSGALGAFGTVWADGTPPDKPTGLSVSVDPQGALLSWDDPGDSTITGYEILRRDRHNDALGTFHTIVEDTEVADTQYTDATIVAGGSYVYRVKALNDAGASQRSSFKRIDVAADWVLVQPVVPEVDPEIVPEVVPDLEPVLTPVELVPTAGDVVAVLDDENSVLESSAQTVNTTLVSNLGQTSLGSFSLNTTNKARAQAFVTGSHTDGYTLSSLTFKAGTFTTTGVTLTAALHESEARGTGNEDYQPAAKVCDLTAPGSLASLGNNEFTAPDACGTLSANTRYFFVVSWDSSSTNTAAWLATDATAEDSGGADGWTIDDEYVRLNVVGGADTWFEAEGDSLLIKIEGAEVFVPPTGTTQVSNLTNSTAFTQTLDTGIADEGAIAQEFDTGSNSKGYILRSVGIRLGAFGSPPSGEQATVAFTVKITQATDDSALSGYHLPGNDVCTLTSPATITASATNTFTAPDSGCPLAASTTYMVFLEQLTSSNVTVGVPLSGFAKTDSSTNWSIPDRIRVGLRTGGFHWTSADRSLKMEIKAEAPNATGAPLILGAAVVGKSMRAYTDGQIADTDGLTNVSYNYQWFRYDGTTETKISGATNSTYTPVTADVGNTLNVVVSFTDVGGTSESLTSLPSETVIAAYPSGTVWMGDLLVEDWRSFGQLFGYWGVRGVGALHPTSIDDGTSTGNVDRLLRADAQVSLGINSNNIGNDVIHTWVLNVGNQSYRFSDALRFGGVGQIDWIRAGTWTAGDKIRVTITTATSVDNDHTTLLKHPALQSHPAMLVKAHSDASDGSVGFGTDYTGSDILAPNTNIYYATAANNASAAVLTSFDRIAVEQDGTLEFVVSFVQRAPDDPQYPQLGKADFARNSLWLDGTQFEFSDATESKDSDGVTTTFSWSSSGLSWSDGDVVPGFLTAENREPTGQPTLVGTAAVGQALTVDLSSVSDPNFVPNTSDVAICKPGEVDAPTYQWVRVATDSTETDISGAESAAYVPVLADAGLTIKVKVTYTDCDGYTNDVVSAASAAVTGGLPIILGPAVQGKSMLVYTGLITDSDGLSSPGYTYQWVSVSSGTDSDISGATSATYSPVAGDVGKTIKVKVTYTDDASNSHTLTSAESEAVVAAYPTGTIWMADLFAVSFDPVLIAAGAVSNGEPFIPGSLIGARSPVRSTLAAFGIDAFGAIHPAGVSHSLASGSVRSLTVDENGKVDLLMTDSGSIAISSLHTWVLTVDGTPLRFSDAIHILRNEDDSRFSRMQWLLNDFSMEPGSILRVSLSTSDSIDNALTDLLKRFQAAITVRVADHDSDPAEGVGFGADYTGSVIRTTSTEVPYLEPVSGGHTEIQTFFTRFAEKGRSLELDLKVPSGVSPAAPQLTKADMERFSLWLGLLELPFGETTAELNADGLTTTFTWSLVNRELSLGDGRILKAFLTVEDRDPTGKPTISGTLTAGQTLTASISDVGDANGLPAASDFTYQWVRVVGTTETNVGSDSTTYRLQSADNGARIKVEVSFTDRDGNDETVVSELTSVVGDTGGETQPPPAEEIDPDGLLTIEPWRIKFSNITTNSARAQVYVNTSEAVTVNIRWRGYFYGYDPAVELEEDEEPEAGWYWSAWESGTFNVEAGFEGRKEYRLRNLYPVTQYEVQASRHSNYMQGLSVGRFGTLTNTNVCARSSGVVRAIERETGYPCMFLLPSDLEGITQLNASHGTMRSIKSIDFAGLPNLKKLYLNNNRITSIPANAFSGLSQLTDLDLSGNPLGSIPSNLFNSVWRLERLWINSAGLTSISSLQFKQLDRLRKLDLSHNRLSSLPGGVLDKQDKLNELLLTGNRLTSLPQNLLVGKTPKLRKLGLSYNQLSSLPSNVFSGLNHLRYIGLAHNKLDNDDLPSSLIPTATLNSVHIDFDNGTADQVVFYLQGNTAITASNPPAVCGADWRIRCVYR